MSVSREDYLILGFNLDEKTFDYDKYEEDMIEYNEELEYGILYDGMNKNYIIAGKVLCKGDEYDGIDLVQFNIDELLDEVVKVKKWAKEKFNLSDVEVRLSCLTHFH